MQCAVVVGNLSNTPIWLPHPFRISNGGICERALIFPHHLRKPVSARGSRDLHLAPRVRIPLHPNVPSPPSHLSFSSLLAPSRILLCLRSSCSSSFSNSPLPHLLRSPSSTSVCLFFRSRSHGISCGPSVINKANPWNPHTPFPSFTQMKRKQEGSEAKHKKSKVFQPRDHDTLVVTQSKREKSQSPFISRECV